MYILSRERDDDRLWPTAFQRYAEYLREVGDRLPPGARELATSDWYFAAESHRSPHDAWLVSATVAEIPPEQQECEVVIQVRLLGAYHDGYIELTYKDVRRYRIEMAPHENEIGFGLRDWRYDEFRLSGESRVEHEIEWSGIRATGTWLIEAADIEYRWSDRTVDNR